MRKIFSLLFMFLFLLSSLSQAQVPSTQKSGGVFQQEKSVEKSRKLEERIETEKISPEEQIKEEILADESGPKVLVTTIVVEDSQLLSAEDLDKILSPYENHELTMKSIQKIADLITAEYRKRGYMTSRAYVPPQAIKDGVLIIRVVEGRLGNLDIQGNRYFRTSLLKKKISLQPGAMFDYSKLQRSLVVLNEHPDRKVKAVLVPGKTPGTTDIIMNVEDRLPIHATLQYDNYGSKYIKRHRYGTTLEHNNLLGFDDRFYAKFQFGPQDLLQLQQFGYLFPINEQWEMGGYAYNSRTRLGKEFEDLDTLGKARVYGIYVNNNFLENDKTILRLNLGFDYKKFTDEILGVEISRDKLRVLRGGFDIDQSDFLGRTILTAELNQGLDILGASPDKNPNGSRLGASGQFTKGLFNLYRLQPLPWETSLLLKNSAQFSNHNLVSSEQFQIGGPTSVRGYAPAEFAGDSGFYSAVEWSLPVYFLSRNVTVPFYKNVKFYDALRFVVFYDFASVYTKNPGIGEKGTHTLKGYGAGIRFNVLNDLACRVEVGFPSGKRSTIDRDQAHPWVEFNWKF